MASGLHWFFQTSDQSSSIDSLSTVLFTISSHFRTWACRKHWHGAVTTTSWILTRRLAVMRPFACGWWGFVDLGFQFTTWHQDMKSMHVELIRAFIVILTHLFYVNLTPTNIVWNWGTPYLSILGSMQCFHSQFCYVQWSIRWLFWQAWAETEGGILRAFMSYCLARFQRNQNSRLNMCVSLWLLHLQCVFMGYITWVCWHILWIDGGLGEFA